MLKSPEFTVPVPSNGAISQPPRNEPTMPTMTLRMMPCCASVFMAIEANEGKLKLKRELEAGWFQWIECPLPAVLSIQSGINKVRYATLKGIMAAKKKELATVTRESLGATIEPTQKVEKIYVPVKTKKTEFLSGPPKEVAAKLVEKLRFEARVI